jgi:hypothetical protein
MKYKFHLAQHASVLSCFSFYKDVDSLTASDLQMKTDFEYDIVHPYRYYQSSTPIENMDRVKVILKLCTLLKGVPYGPAYIKCTIPGDERSSFKGVGVFD